MTGYDVLHQESQELTRKLYRKAGDRSTFAGFPLGAVLHAAISFGLVTPDAMHISPGWTVPFDDADQLLDRLVQDMVLE